MNLMPTNEMYILFTILIACIGTFATVSPFGYQQATVSSPDCQQAAPPEQNLTHVRTATISVPADPFGIVYASEKDTAFVALGTNLGVLNTSAFTPRLVHEVPLPAAILSATGATGIALTHDGRHVLVTAYNKSVAIINAARAASGSPNAVVGILNGIATPGAGAISVTITPDDKYAFVNEENAANFGVGPGFINVYKLDGLAANGSAAGSYVGSLPLGYLVTASALSPDGKTLYATSERNLSGSTQGTLSTIDVEKLKTSPSTALISNTDAGCGPVRPLVSRDGSTVWVTARESNHLLAFNTTKLVSDPSAALRASVQVGTSPVGLIFAAGEKRILTADSNRHGYANATTGLSVIDVDAALHGRPAVLGSVPTGMFPREFAIDHAGENILVTDYSSKQIQAIAVASLP